MLIVLIDFGPGKLSELGSAIGRSIREFRRNVRDETSGQRAAERARTPETAFLRWTLARLRRVPGFRVPCH
ncbi:twin-arginine translocase TatA/TatE family subunit [Thermomicrobium sp.]|uniref:twin-arginine translocase TatA/TatE family subunit n=1 Tax=Thermomicrobium sp. TaxID=1969469 RepID=UPI00257F6FCD|nr:twin-arginine translocase TatA/TatE family subunit [Thermomicrobium sp.]